MNIITRDTRTPTQAELLAGWYAQAASLNMLMLGPRFGVDFDRQFAREYERDEAADGRERIATGDWP